MESKKKKQNTVSKCSAEFEYKSMCFALYEIVWLRNLLVELSFNQNEQVILYCDNKATIQIANNRVFHEITKHVEIVCHYIKKTLFENVVQLKHVKT